MLLLCKLWVFIIPLSFFFLFWVSLLLKNILYNKGMFKYLNIDKKTSRQFYFLFSIIWMLVVICTYYSDILNSNIVDVNKVGNVWNLIYVTLGMFVFIVVWDFLFISCRSISSVIIKDMKIMSEELEELKVSEIIESKYFDTLKNILNAEHTLISNMSDFVNNDILESDIEGVSIYKLLLKKYAKVRKDLKIQIYTYDKQGYKALCESGNVSDAKLSGIQYSIESLGFCVPTDTSKDIIYALIVPRCSDAFIIKLEADYLYSSEHLIIENLINVFDTTLELVYRQHEDDLCDIQSD